MVLMIGLKTLKDEYLLDDNIDDKYVLPIIKKGQDFIISKVLGLTKYNQLINDISNNTVSQEDDILIKDYIQPVLAYFVQAEVVYSVAYKLKNNPDFINNPSTSERFNELVRISAKYLQDSQAYEQILRDYICDNNIILSTEDSPVLKSGYHTGLFLG